MKEEKLVHLCRKKKSSAQKKVYEAYSPQMRAICRRYITDWDEAEDILQESFFTVFTKIDSFTWTGDNSFFFWIKRIIINNSINCFKKNKRKYAEETLSEKENFLVEDDDDNIFDGVDVKFSKEDVRTAFENVPPTYSMVLNLAIIDGLRHKEIAELMEITEETSRCRLARGKKLFKEELEAQRNIRGTIVRSL